MGRFGRFLRREVHGMDSMGGANLHAFAAHLAFVAVYVCHVVGYRDGFKLTLFGTLAATYAGSRTGFACYAAFFFVYTTYIHTATFGSFFAQLYDVSGASLHTCAAGGTFLYVYDGQSGSGIERERAELTGSYAVAASEAPVGACRFAGIEAVDDGATDSALIRVDTRTVFACAVASYYGNTGSGVGCFHS